MKEALYFVWICFLAILLMILCGCSAVPPSESVSNAARNDLKELSSEIRDMSSRVVAECPKYAENLRNISVRLENVSSQVGNISLACKSEKKYLEQLVSNRNIWIGILLGIIGILIYFIIFSKKVLTF